MEEEEILVDPQVSIIQKDKEKVHSNLGLIMKHEGFELDPYQLEYKGVKEDFFTGGVGHKMSQEDIDEFDYDWTKDQKKKYWLNKLNEDFIDAKIASIELADEYGFKPTEAQDKVLTSMAFQLGKKGLGNFRDALTAMSEGMPEEAASAMLDSRWAREQTPDRAKHLSDLILKDKEGTNGYSE